MTTKLNIDQLSDEELMANFIHQKDQKSFELLYQRYFDSLSKYLGWLNNDLGKGKDIAQNIFLKIYQKPNSFDYSKVFKIWLFSIAKNQTKNEWRNEALRIKHQNLFSDQQKITASQNIPNDTRLRDLKSALDSLSENHREVFVLKYSNNLTIQEISEICNCSVGTVKSRLFYALQKLKNKLS